MAKGISTNIKITSKAECLKGKGLNFVFRYYCNSGNSKLMTKTEAKALAAVGLKICAFFQNFNNSIDKFSAEIGMSQAKRALVCAKAVNQPIGTPIFFAVDFDAEKSEINGPITAYFKAISAIFHDSGYLIGVYGSGLTCSTLHAAGHVTHTCRSESTAHHPAPPGFVFDVIQSVADGTTCSMPDSDYENCTTTKAEGFGEFTPLP